VRDRQVDAALHPVGQVHPQPAGDAWRQGGKDDLVEPLAAEDVADGAQGIGVADLAVGLRAGLARRVSSSPSRACACAWACRSSAASAGGGSAKMPPPAVAGTPNGGGHRYWSIGVAGTST
jgi:hypothetical protein